MRIGFFAGKCLPVHANTLEERPLGGTETGLIHVARILSGRGFDVTVFTSHKDPPKSTPQYLYYEDVLKAGSFDVLVAIKDWWPAFYGVPCKRLFYWTGDSPDQYVNFGIGDKRVAARIDKFLAASKWHAETFCAGTGFPFEKSVVVGNGVNIEYFVGSEARGKKRLIYTSPPYRGLALVAPLYLELKKLHPELELHIFSGYSLYDTDKPFAGPQLSESEKIFEGVKNLPGCYLHGNVTQKALAREFMKSRILFYPNIVMETCCISALEAQAGGAAVVTSALAALPETVGDAGFLIKGVPGSREYSKAFIEATHAILSDDELFGRLSLNARSRIEQEYTWDHVADRFEKLIGS